LEYVWNEMSHMEQHLLSRFAEEHCLWQTSYGAEGSKKLRQAGTRVPTGIPGSRIGPRFMSTPRKRWRNDSCIVRPIPETACRKSTAVISCLGRCSTSSRMRLEWIPKSFQTSSGSGRSILVTELTPVSEDVGQKG